MKRTIFVLSLALITFCGSSGRAQTTIGTISGTVKDGTGAVLPAAKLVLLNEETGISRTVQTDSAGRYSGPLLGLGNYRVTVSMEGFQTQVRSGIVLTVGREAIVDLVLSVGAVTETVEVTGEAPLVESTTSSLGALVDDRTIRDLPLNGRSYDQLALLQPGVIALGGGQNAGFQYGTGKRFSVAGGRSDSNSFLLDGTDINDQANSTPGGAAGTNLGVDAIREFKILTNSFSAEYGRAAGAIITAVTRSGTNILHGSVFEYIRNNHLDARNFFDTGSSPPPFKRNQFGGVLGGPIRKDKVFFFAGYEGLRQGLGSTLVAFVPTLDSKRGILPNAVVAVNPFITPYLALYPAPNGRSFGDGTAEFLSSPSTITNEDNFMVRVDHQFNNNTSIFARYAFDNDSVNSPDPIPNFETTTSSRRQYTTLQVNSILGPSLLNNFRFAYNRSFQRSDNLPTVQLGPEFSFIPGQPMGTFQVGPVAGSFQRTVTLLGTSSGAPRLYGYNIFQWGDDLSVLKGKHSFKTGAVIERIRDNTALNTNLRGTITFTTFNDMLAGKPSNLSATGVGQSAYRGFRQTIAGVYAQDDITVNSRLTLNLGLRWEAVTDPTETNGMVSGILSPAAAQSVILGRFFHIAKKNFEPRAGFAWRLDARGKTVLRAGGGIFHNHVLPYVYALNVAKIPPFYNLLSANNPSFPGSFQTLAAGGLTRLNPVDMKMKELAKDQYNVSLEQQIFKDTVVELSYVGAKANHIIRFSEKNTPNPTILPDGRKFFPAGSRRVNPNWDSIRMMTGDTNSIYNAVTITLRRRSPTGFQYQAFYTFSKGTDENSTTATPERDASTSLDPTDQKRDWGLASFDSRHHFVFNFTYPLHFQFSSKTLGAVLGGWSINGIGTFSTGQPFTPRLATNNSRNLDIQNPDRPDLKPGASNNPVLGGPDRYYNAGAFSLPLPGTYGNLGRNTLIGPGLASVDMSVEKGFKVRENANAMFRAEIFDVANRANFGLPSVNALTSAGVPNGSAGRITSTVTSSRQIQFGVKINF